MVFKCQEDSFLKQYKSVVVECNPSLFTTLINGTETSINGFEVLLEQTILFPEGGGQPSDHGFINNSKVYKVLRKGKTAVHYVDKPLVKDEQVEMKVDWERRFDHMQQHSGQHLISAILEREFKYNSVSWKLGEQISHVELDTLEITPEQIKIAESIVNDLIISNKKVTVETFQASDNVNGLRPNSLPEDHEGEVRVINIEGIDSNMCCGTHVNNLSQLQIVKFLKTEKSTRKDNTLLHFLVGNRVLKYLGCCLDREQQLTTLLNTGPPDHPLLVEKLQKNVKVLNKDLQNVLKDLAVLEAYKLKNISPAPKYYTLHRKEADLSFMNLFIKELGSVDIFLFLSVGEDKGPGNIILYGKSEAITDLGQRIISLLDGKGNGKGNKFQGKVNKLQNRSAVEELLLKYFT